MTRVELRLKAGEESGEGSVCFLVSEEVADQIKKAFDGKSPFSFPDAEGRPCRVDLGAYNYLLIERP